MNRRKFIQRGSAYSILSLAPLKAIAGSGIEATTDPTVYDAGENIILGNQYVEWNIAVSETGIRSKSLRVQANRTTLPNRGLQ